MSSLAIRGSLKGLHSPDLVDMQVSAPPNPENFSILVQAMIGPEGEDGSETFDFVVCSPQWLEDNVPEEGHLFARHHLILKSYSYKTIWHAIERLCQRTWGRNWEEVANKLAQYGHWEFEDYQDNSQT